MTRAGTRRHRIAWRAPMLALALLVLPAQRDPILVPEVSQDEVRLRQGFTGTELLLFGAILDPTGQRAGRAYDIVVVLKGPVEAIRVREKEQVGGIWINARSNDYRSAPAFYALAATRPIEQIVDEKTAAIFEFGTRFIQMSPSGTIDPVEQTRFQEGLVDQRRRQGLYKEEIGGVTLREDVLYQARIALPSNVRTGTYTAETFAVARGRVIASAIAEVEVRKVGFERFVEDSSQHYSLLYGIAAVVLSVGTGLVAGRVLARG